MAVVTDASPASDPTERSISPEAMTKVMATAMTVIVEVWRTMFIRLLSVRNPLPLREIENTRNTRIKPP